MPTPFDPLSLTKDDIGKYLRIETKVKSKPIIGRITNVVDRSTQGMVRVELEMAFGIKPYFLTKNNETSWED
ncbi:hypothetical protein BJD55_gp066 [Gordonia phage Yvonnetastic]|uniref:Uncharacterized protein n=1 Tax=Gordonia phage Yvonnetastic TaxID=1821566 RepID=A0A142K9B7_9CAUD|nr:hypothetical protein BJD55_gp066 [Gordonia phage Yvonnetastic]AMS02700.1 hypothetical protein SEA_YVONNETASTIC_156 [Gordonia phage Yvonnetastic]WKW86135.1 hypothetical protein SEA_JONJAMES_161 [Gordonia Phage JonJames]